MARDLLMPKLGLTMTEGTILEWTAKLGDPVKVGDVLFVIETDKVAFDVEAEQGGVLLEIAVPVGTTVAVGTRLGLIGVPEEAGPPAHGDASVTAAPAAAVVVAPAAVAREASAAAPVSMPAARGGRIIATPRARKLAAAAGMDLASVRGSGPLGRIKAADAENAASSAPRDLNAVPNVAAAQTAASGSRRRPSAMQATMARRLSEVKQGVPHFYLAAEAEVSALIALRGTVNSEAGRPKVTMTTFIVAAVGRALADLPDANTVWMEGELVTFGAADVGIAVNAPQGLYVPVVRDAGRKSIERIATESTVLVERAREGKLTHDEMAGGAFTVSNAGMYNVTYMTPIVNPGQSAVLGVGSVRQIFRPDTEGRPALRRELGLVLAADHRVFGGVSGLELLNRIIGYLESPSGLLRTA